MLAAVACSVLLPMVGYPIQPPTGRAPLSLAQTILPLGTRAPPIRLSDTDGSTWDLAERASGDSVVVLFYRGAWCPHSRRQLVDMQSNLQMFTARGTRLVAVSVDSVETSRETAEELGLDFPVLSDPNAEVGRAFGIHDEANGIAWPAVFVVDDGDRIVWRAVESTYQAQAPARRVLAALPR